MAADKLSKKQRTHERIVETAAKALRRDGAAGVGVAEVMREAGLTHGGFYAHFPSREAMVAEALDRAAGTGFANLTAGAARLVASKGATPLEGFVASYLSDRHVEHRELGCALAAVGSELPHESGPVRAVATRRIREMVDLVERHMAGWGQPGGHADALAATSCLVGALVIARAVDDPQLALDVREAAATVVRALDASAPEVEPARKRAPRTRAS